MLPELTSSRDCSARYRRRHLFWFGLFGPQGFFLHFYNMLSLSFLVFLSSDTRTLLGLEILVRPSNHDLVANVCDKLHRDGYVGSN